MLADTYNATVYGNYPSMKFFEMTFGYGGTPVSTPWTEKKDFNENTIVYMSPSIGVGNFTASLPIPPVKYTPHTKPWWWRMISIK